MRVYVCVWVMGDGYVSLHCSCVIDYRNLNSENTLYNNSNNNDNITTMPVCGVRVSCTSIIYNMYNILYFGYLRRRHRRFYCRVIIYIKSLWRSLRKNDKRKYMFEN